ncbi:kinase-like protein [Lentithecium fluviatile CBS 122367]|uniref:Kinase-like protein n=1 Tax=Lentithecium fluviatile CBS 122367 TaxID=1168545 RepID=A0A6G1IR48_9PLEO|nr:kinase-like protein [Lentithecium fluviatile CBS 122367]
MCHQPVLRDWYFGCGDTTKMDYGSPVYCAEKDKPGHKIEKRVVGSSNKEGKCGRTSFVHCVKEGVVGKVPRKTHDEKLNAEFKNAFAVEKQLLERLGDHPRIAMNGLLLEEATHGHLQSYIDGDSKIDSALRKKWCLQIVEAVAYVHEKGIIHSNVGTTNILVHQTGQTMDLKLADFGGSRCLELGLNGDLIPDDPFLDRQLTDFTSPRVDVFSLGVVIYIIMTGHYPFHKGPAPQNEEIYVYEDRVQKLFGQGKFPDLSDVPFGVVIAGCCCERRFENAKEVVEALEAEM